MHVHTFICGQPRGSGVRQTGDREVAGSATAGLATFFRRDLI